MRCSNCGSEIKSEDLVFIPKSRGVWIDFKPCLACGSRTCATMAAISANIAEIVRADLFKSPMKIMDEIQRN